MLAFCQGQHLYASHMHAVLAAHRASCPDLGCGLVAEHDPLVQSGEAPELDPAPQGRLPEQPSGERSDAVQGPRAPMTGLGR